jgi:hypothetical protein
MTTTAPNPQVPPQDTAELAIWKQARRDYKQARALAFEAMDAGDGFPADSAAIQAATATILNHVRELREDAARVQRQAHAGTNTNGSPPPAGVEIPEACPQCQGEMYDNRGDKKHARSPDFKCKDPECGKAIWLTPPPKGAKARR